ncbi:DNA-directed RNA polymerase subunit beta [Triticum urartu]|uniref:DNA-directed RNA polymerase n=1 Tax=Triticum urartu TaxID=4572 RepID=M7YBH1_TRIUA|nr:DNA-directed RNA polymerase subunit beta [Triticum urartu]
MPPKNPIKNLENSKKLKIKMLRNGNEGMSTIPGFSQIQFEGFCRFINQALAEELDKFPTIKDPDHEIAFQLFAKGYQLLEPSIKERDAVYESLTYSSELYVSARLIFGFDVQKQTISIGNIPIMNSLGTFIINGIYRIVINQILLSPGIYYRSELDHKGISIYTGTIISDWGGRSELAIDKKERIWARVSRKQKISILVLSSAMGSNLREILDNVSYPEIFLSFPNAKEKKRIESKEKAILEFYQQFACVGGDLVFSESLCEELQKKFFQQKCELGRIGRRNMNRRLNLDIPQNNTFLLPRDVLAATDHLIGMKFGTGRCAWAVMALSHMDSSMCSSAPAPGVTAPGATTSTSLTWGGGELVALGGKVALLPIPLGTVDFLVGELSLEHRLSSRTRLHRRIIKQNSQLDHTKSFYSTRSRYYQKDRTKKTVIDLGLEVLDFLMKLEDALPNVLDVQLVVVGELCDHNVIGIEPTLHHLLTLVNFLLQCLEPCLRASGLPWSLNIADVQQHLTHLNGLRVLQHFREVGVDDLLEELVLGGHLKMT